MALSLQSQTLALLGRNFLAQALANGGSMDDVIIDTLLHPQPKSAKEISATALTGRIRSDAGMLRQASKNADEAASIAAIAKEGTDSIATSLKAMKDLAQSVADGTATPDAATNYMNLAQSIKGVVSSTSYNGISLLDKDGWSGDERLTVDGGGDSAALSIQIGMGTSTLTLRDLSGLKTAFSATDLADPIAAAATATQLSEQLATIETMSSGYAGVAASYAGEAKSLTRQSEILATTAARAQMGAEGGKPTPDANSLLLDLLLRDQGKLIDTSS